MDASIDQEQRGGESGMEQRPESVHSSGSRTGRARASPVSSVDGSLDRQSGRQDYSESSLSSSEDDTLPTGTDPDIQGLSLRAHRRFHRRIEGTWRWLSDICPAVHISVVGFILQYTQFNLLCPDNSCLAVIFHAESSRQGHLHIYHACTFANSTCRCKWFKRFISAIAAANQKAAFNDRATTEHREGQETFAHGRRKRRYRPNDVLKSRAGRRIVYAQEVNLKHWYQLLQYYSTGGRQMLHLEIGGKTLVHGMGRLEDLRGRSLSESGRESNELLEACEFSGQDCFGIGSVSSALEEDGGSTAGPSTSHSRGGQSVPGRGQGSERYQVVPKKLKSRLEDHRFVLGGLRQFVCVPISSTCDIEQWLFDESLSYYNKSEPDYKRACDLFQRELCCMDMLDIAMLALNAKHLCYLSRTNGHYFSVRESLEHIEELLEHQYADGVADFVQRLYCIAERLVEKRNAMFIRGPPNCGKSWFVDMVSSFYINVGYVGNFNKYNVFPLNDAASKRILIWNEPNIESSAFDTVKMLTAGDPCPANIKYQSNITITRTPIIFTSNKAIFNETDPVWTSRIDFEPPWHTASFLKEHQKKPHPMTYFALCSKYLSPYTYANPKKYNVNEMLNKCLELY